MSPHSLAIEIVEADLARPEHQRAVCEMLDAYARDPMGGERPLEDDVRQRLVPALREHPTTVILACTCRAESDRHHRGLLARTARTSDRHILGFVDGVSERLAGDSEKHREGNAEAFGQGVDLARVQIPLAVQDFGDNAVRVVLRQLR